MPLLTINNLSTSTLSIQDPTGLSGVSLLVPGSGAISGYALTLSALAAIESQLIAEAAASNITWSVSDDPASNADVLPEHLHTVLTTPYNAVAGDQVIYVNLTVAAATSVVLSAAAQVGQLVTVIDGKGDAAAHNITITVAGGGTVNGGANLVLSTNRQQARLLKVGATAWVGVRAVP